MIGNIAKDLLTLFLTWPVLGKMMVSDGSWASIGRSCLKSVAMFSRSSSASTPLTTIAVSLLPRKYKIILGIKIFQEL